MNEEAIQQGYSIFKSEGYNGSIDDYKQLISTNGNALKQTYDIFKQEGYNEDINSFKTLMGIGSIKKKSQAENGGSTLGVGSSVSPKTDYSKYKKVGDKYYSGNGEFFDNYPGKEGKGYRFNDNQWYEYSSTILGDKEQIEKLDNPIKDPRRVLALNKQFNKTAGTEKGVFIGYPGKEQNEYKINNDGTWQRRTPENKTWVTVTNENSISALNNQFGQSAKKIELEKISKIKEDNLYQSNFYANLKSINAQLIGGEEEEAVDVLRRKFPLFTFNEINAGDKIEITSPKGNKEQFTLDNWTWDKDKKISEEMIGWMEGNNLSPSEKKQYANVRRANAEEASFKYPNIGDTAAMKAMQEDMSLNLKKAINPNDVTAPSLELTQYKLEKEKANKKAKELRADWMPIKSQKLNDIVNKYSEYTSYKGNVSEYEKTRAQAALGALASDKVEIGNVNKYQEDIKYNIDSYKTKLNDTSFFNNLQNKYDNGEITEDQYKTDYTNRQKELIDQEKEIQNQIKISDGLIKNVNKSVGENYLIQETKGSIGGGLVLGAIKGVLSPVRLLAGSTGRDMSAAEYHEAVKEAISPLWDFDTSLEYLRSEERSDLTKAAFSVAESLGAMAPMALSGGATLLGTGLLARGAMTATAFYPMSYYEMKDELEEIDIPESDKVAMASIYGVVSSALESIGMEYALGKIDTAIGSSIKRNILKKVLGKSLPKDAPKEAIDALVRNETKSYIASLGLGTLGAMSVEGVTESLQSLTGAGIKEIYDTAKDTEFFSNEGFGDIVKGALYEGYLGALGGGMVHSIYIAKDAYKRNNVLKSKELNNLLMAAKTSGMSEALMSNLKSDMLSNRITKEQAEEISNNFEIVRGMTNQMPENLTVEGQSASLSLMLEKNELNKQIEGKDPNLVKRQAARVNEINERLQEIGEKNTVENAIQEQTAGQVPVQPTTTVGEEVVQGEPTAEPQVLTEEGKAEEVELTPRQKVEAKLEANKKAVAATVVEAPVEEDNTFVYKINKEKTPSGKGKWEDDFEIIDNRDGQSFGEDSAKWVVYNNVSGTSVDALSKKDAQDIIKNAPSYEGLWNEGETINFTELNSKQQENYREEFNRQKAAKAPVVEVTPQEKVATYRAEEQAELLKAIPKIESYKVNGEIDKNLMSNAVLAKYNKIYEKYNALISPLLEPVVKEVTKTDSFFNEVETAFPFDDIRGGYAVTNKEGNQIGRVKMSFVNDNTIKIDEIVSQKMGERTGNGSATMKNVTDIADNNNVTLTLTPNLIGGIKAKGFENSQKLKNFYKKFGFVVDEGKGTMTRQPSKAKAPVVETPIVKAEAPKAKGELPVLSWSNVDRYKDDVIMAMREIQNKLLTPLLALKYNTTAKQKKQIIDIRAKIELADKILKRNFAKAKREQAKIEKEKNIKPTAKVETTKTKVASKAKVEEEPVEEEAKVEPVVEEVVEVEQYQPITIEKIFNDRFSKEDAISYDEDERENDNGRMSTYISSITMDVTNEDGDSIGALTKLVDEDRIITWNGEDFDGNQLSEQDFDFKDDARQAIVDKWNKEQKKNFDREAKKKIKDAQKAKEKADKAAAKEEAKSASVVKKEEAPAPAKESTAEEGGILNDIEKIQEDINSINEDIEKARTEARNKVNAIDLQKVEAKLKSTLEELNDKIADIEIALEKVLDPLQIELLEKVTELDQKVKSLKNTENENTLLDYLKKARESLKTLDKLTYVKLDLGISLKTAQLVLDGLIKIVETATNLKKKITLKQAINEMYDKYKDIHPNVSKKRFIQDVNDFLDNTFVEQKTNKENLQDTQDKLVEFEKAVRLIAASKLREAERVVRKMLKGKVRSLTPVQVKSIMRRLVNFNVFSQTQYDKFIDYVDKVIGIADYDAKVTKANKDRKFAKKNMIKLGDISSDLLVPLSRVLNINAKLIPKDVFESYSEMIDMLSKRAEVLKLNERSNLNESIDKIIESIESNEQRISDLKELYDNFEKVKSKTNEEVYSKTLDKMLKEGVIDKAEHELMKTFKLKILDEKGKVKKMTDQQIADEKVELIKEVKKTTITLDEIVGDEFRLERELVKRLQIILKQTDFQKLNNKELKDLLRIIDNINNGFVSNATQQMVEKLNKIKSGVLLAAAIPKSLKGIFRKAANVRRKVTKNIFGKTLQSDEFGIDAFAASSVDEQLNNFKSTPIFDITREQSAIQIEKFKAKMTEIVSELARAENEMASWNSFRRSGNKMQLSKFKMSIYMMQLEYNSNPNSNQVHQAMKTLNKTIDFANENKGISTYSDLDIKQMEFIKDNFQKDGEIDIDKLYKSFNKQEKDAIEIFKKINSEMTKFATYTATVINGKKIEPINNYFFYNTINENKTSAQQITARINNINDNMNPTTVSKNLEERDGNVHAVQLNPFNAVNISARSVLLNYYMTEPIRTTKKILAEARKIIKENKDNGVDVGKQFDILSVLEKSYDTAFSDLVESYINESQAFFDYIKKTSYRAILGSAPKALGELLSNGYGAWVKYPKDMIEGVALKEIVDKDLLVNLGSKLASRLFSSDKLNSSNQIDLSNITNRITKNGKTRTKIVNGITQVWDYTAVKWVDVVGTIADELIAQPDQRVHIPLWLGSFSRAFQKETGVEFNENKIKANDEEYMDKYRDALAKATKIADRNVDTLGGNKNPFMAVLQNAVRNDDNFLQASIKNFQQFMGTFLRKDYDSARKGLNALVGNGTISKTDGGILLSVIFTRQVLYGYLVKSFIELFAILTAPSVEFLFSLFGFADDDDDDEKTILENVDDYFAKGFTGELQKFFKSSLSAITTLLLGGNSGNLLRVGENYFIEKANKKYGEKIGLRDGEYDPYKDAIQFNQFQDIDTKDEALVKIGKVFFPEYAPVIGVTEVGLKLLLSPEPEGDRAKLTRAKEYVRLGLEAAGNAGVMPFYKDIRKVVVKEVYKELSKEVKETAVKKEAQAKTDAEEIVQKTSILKQMMNSGEYTREGIKKELRKIKDPEYRKAEKKIEDDMLKSILDKTKYSSRTDFEKREKENAKNAFKMYDKKREESLKINRELTNRMDALEYGEQYVPKKEKASGTFGGGDSFGGSSSFGGSDSFGGGDSFGGSSSFGNSSKQTKSRRSRRY